MLILGESMERKFQRRKIIALHKINISRSQNFPKKTKCQLKKKKKTLEKHTQQMNSFVSVQINKNDTKTIVGKLAKAVNEAVNRIGHTNS